jgi:hypothetical protein
VAMGHWGLRSGSSEGGIVAEEGGEE